MIQNGMMSSYEGLTCIIIFTCIMGFTCIMSFTCMDTKINCLFRSTSLKSRNYFFIEIILIENSKILKKFSD